MNRLTKRCNGVVTYISASNEYETGQIACEVSPQGVRELLDEYHKVADPLLLAKAQGRLAVLRRG